MINIVTYWKSNKIYIIIKCIEFRLKVYIII